MTKTGYCVSAEDVMALLDGELSAADARTISAHVEQCSECALLMEQLRGVSESLSRWSIPEVPMAVEEFVEERLEKVSSRRRMIRVSFSSKKLLAVSGSGVLALITLWLVAVWTHPHTERRALMMLEPTQQTRSVPENGLYAHEARPKARAGVAGMAGESPTADSNGQFRSTDGEVLNTFQASTPMIARTMSLTLLVKDVETARASLDTILARHHGYSAQLDVSSPETGSSTIKASLRVPEPELTSASAEIKSLGRVINESQSGEEVSQQHADLVARLKTARETEVRFQAILQQRTGKVSDVLEVERSIARVRGEIEAMEAEQKTLEHRVDFATVDVQLTEEYKAKLESPAADSVSTRMHNSFVAGYHNATETLLGIVLFAEEYGPPILIWLAILGVPAVAIWRRYKKIRS